MILPLLVIIPLGGAFLISLSARLSKRICDFVGNISTFSLFVLSVYLLKFTTKTLVYKVGGWMPPVGINLVADGLSIFMVFTVNFVAFMISVFSISYMKKYTSKWKFYTLFLLMLAGMNGVLLTGDIFNLFVFLEIASVASFALVAFGTESEELEASFKYMVMSGVAALFILIGIAVLYSYASTLNMADLAGYLKANPNPKVLGFVSVLFIMGFGLKAALVPFHAWLPDAHPSAPAPISAALSGLLIKTLGVYAILRIFFNVFGVNSFVLNSFMFLGAVSIIIGVLLAIGQTDFKRLLAYHSISQIGYIFLGVGLGNPIGILGGLFHLFNHSVFKSLLFLNSGAVEYCTGTRNLQEMGGLRERMPTTASTSLIASMSIAGIPPFNGFWSKLLIIWGAIKIQHTGYAILAVIGSILTLSSFMKVQKFAFFGKLKESLSQVKQAPFSMKLSMVILSVVCIVAGLILLPKVAEWFLNPAKDILLSGLEYKDLVFGSLK